MISASKMSLCYLLSYLCVIIGEKTAREPKNTTKLKKATKKQLETKKSELSKKWLEFFIFANKISLTKFFAEISKEGNVLVHCT